MKRLPIRIVVGGAFAALVLSCSPTMVSLPVERLEPSAAKVDVIGEPVNLTYRGIADSTNIAFFNSLASGFEKILPVVDTATSLNFVFDSVAAGPFIRLGDLFDDDTEEYVYTVSFPYSFTLNLFQEGLLKDSYLAEDELDWQMRSRTEMPDDSIVSAVSSDFYPTVSGVGENMASAFFPQWVRDYREIYTKSSGKWKEAEESARDFDWSTAQRIWLELTKSDNLAEVYAASFNIVVADEILGDTADALKWVSFLEKHFPSKTPAYLRRRFEKK